MDSGTTASLSFGTTTYKTLSSPPWRICLQRFLDTHLRILTQVRSQEQPKLSHRAHDPIPTNHIPPYTLSTISNVSIISNNSCISVSYKQHQQPLQRPLTSITPISTLYILTLRPTTASDALLHRAHTHAHADSFPTHQRQSPSPTHNTRPTRITQTQTTSIHSTRGEEAAAETQTRPNQQSRVHAPHDSDPDVRRRRATPPSPDNPTRFNSTSPYMWVYVGDMGFGDCNMDILRVCVGC